MRIGHRLLAATAADVGVHRIALDGARPDEGDLDHQVVEAARLDARERPHLSPALDLEHPDGVSPAEHVVDGVVLREVAEVDDDPLVLGHQVDHPMEGAEHPEAEQVELHEADRRTVILVPLQHAAPRGAAPLDRAHLDHRPVAQDHPGRVDPEVARPVEHVHRHRRHQRRHGCGRARVRGGRRRSRADGRPIGPRPPAAVHRPGPPVRLLHRGAQRPGHVAHRRARPVGDHVGHLGGVPPAVAGVDVLDHLLPSSRLDVDVDVGRAVTGGRQEALEEQAELDRVGVGDPEGEARRRVRRRASALAVDPLGPAELGDVVDDEEVAGEAHEPDHAELVVDLRPGAGDALGTPRAVAGGRPLLDQGGQVLHLADAPGAREVRQSWGDQPEVERTVVRQQHRRLHRPRPATHPAHLLGRPAQARARRRREPALEVGQAPSGPGGRQGGEPGEVAGRGVVDVVGGDERRSGGGGQ